MASWALKLKRNNPLCATARALKRRLAGYRLELSFVRPLRHPQKNLPQGEGFLWWWIRPHWIMDIKKSREYKEMQQIRGQTGLTLYHPFKSLFF